MPLIRAKDAETKLAQAEVMRLQDVEAEAQRMLADARRHAEAILGEARARAQRLKADAHRMGLEAGKVEGLRTGQELGRKQAYDQAVADFAGRHASLAKALAAALEQFEALRRGLQSGMERDVIALAGAIAHRVTKRAVEVDPACVTGNLREALQLISQRNRLEIRLHPADLEQAREFARDLLPARDFESVVFVADESVGRAGTLLRTAGGQVDATVNTQWTRVLDEILAGWQEHWLLSSAMLEDRDAAPHGDDPQFVELVQDEQADPPVQAPPAEWPASDAAAQQALIDQAIGEAMRVSTKGTDGPVVQADAAVVEEIDPVEVEQIDLDKVEEIDPDDVAD